jgi:hypothetical protein
MAPREAGKAAPTPSFPANIRRAKGGVAQEDQVDNSSEVFTPKELEGREETGTLPSAATTLGAPAAAWDGMVLRKRKQRCPTCPLAPPSACVVYFCILCCSLMGSAARTASATGQGRQVQSVP